jgi:hypothetical protein
MNFSKEWSRRRFLAVSSATAAQAAARLKGFSQTVSPAEAAAAAKKNLQESARLMPPPEVISGGIQPLMKGHTARPLRYQPINGDFVIRNGGEYFNRPLYAPCSTEHSADFRVDASDVPEFSLYLPGHGGNLKLGFISAKDSESKWGAVADEVIARYRPGRMIYEMRDALLGKGTIRAELITSGEGSGILLKVEGTDLPAGTKLAWAFGGVSGKKGRRNGDIGCEVQPVSQFFQLRPDECEGNTYLKTVVVDDAGGSARPSSRLTSKSALLLLTFPSGSKLRVEEFAAWSSAPANVTALANEEDTVKQPVLMGLVEITSAPILLTIDRLSDTTDAMLHSAGGDQMNRFVTRSEQIDTLAKTLTLETPDAHLNTVGAALSVAAETVWDAHSQCVLHGGVAWRTMLAGWRGPYVLDALGHHDRARQHFRHWLKKQNLTAVTTSDPAVGPWDPAPNIHLTRKEGMLHSNGDLSANHYDMNMVFIDVMLRHLMWTGDMDFAREIWPYLQRHLAWEHRLFRRTYKTADGKELPLYEAYAAIWASDNLQYNGGGTMHSSAYNLFAFRTAAKLAHALGEDASAYEAEAALLKEGIEQLLWLPAQGAYAESKDLLGPQTTYNNPALWTVYHTIDSEVPTPRQAWQMCAERLAALRHVPIHGEGVPDEGLYMLSCSDWLPYVWSLNLLLLAENAHMALALWQTGMADEAYRILKGNLLDSMFMGLSPGDFHMTSALDAHRQEAQRDFADPMGITARALVEGLFGIQPDLIANCIRIRPGFPTGWDRATLRHQDFDFSWQCKKQLIPTTGSTAMQTSASESYEFISRLSRTVPITLNLPAQTSRIPDVICNGASVTCAFDPDAVGSPRVILQLPAARSYKISLKWNGFAPAQNLPNVSFLAGEMFFDWKINMDVRIAGDQSLGLALFGVAADDPQHALTDGRVTSPGFHTIFFNMKQDDCAWSLPLSFDVKPSTPVFAAIPALPAGAHTESLDLTTLLKDQINEIFTRVYAEPRSQFCSLALADNLLGGWANPDNRANIDDGGLRAAGGVLHTPLGVDFRTPAGNVPNCLFLSYWKQDAPSVKLALTGHSSGIYLLVAGSTFPQFSRMTHATVSVNYTDGSSATLALRNPETWWPIEQDYMLDDYLFVNDAPLPPRVNLRTGQTRILDPIASHGKGRTVPGGAATILHLPLDANKSLASLDLRVELYGVVVALLGATLTRV